jgi:murein DD-endopeptidase MepM/ murein hydrolase activator NlpD
LSSQIDWTDYYTYGIIRTIVLYFFFFEDLVSVEYTEEFVYGVPEEEWVYEDYALPGRTSSVLGMHALTLVAVLLVAFMGYKLMRDRVGSQEAAKPPASHPPVQAEALPPIDFTAVTAPYDTYTLTQGIHGASYGHMAIDLAAGQGTTIKSPIHGVVTELYVDQYGNPTLVIENEVYQVMMLHGEYSVAIGQQVGFGQTVGVESNLGYTTDMAGVPCWGRDCGYHTHLNIYDKRIGANVNPLLLIGN